jgi:lysophospholipase L1-like esterase
MERKNVQIRESAPNSQKDAHMKHLAFGTIAVAIGTIVGLAGAEAGVRILSLAPPNQNVFGGYAPDPYLPFKMRPLSQESGQTSEFRYSYTHNSVGFRDVEHDATKAPGVFRILGLGDSFTYGAGAEFDKTYLYRLEQNLRARSKDHPAVEVIKAGIPRYFPTAERILLEHYGLSYRPDLVIVGVLPNDVVDTFLGLDAVRVDSTGHLRTREASEFGKLGVLIYRHSHLGRMLIRTHIDRRRKPRMEEMYRSGGFHEKDWLVMEKEYERIADLSDSIGAKLVLVHIPQQGPWTAEHEYMPSRIGAWAAKRGVHFVDVLPEMKKSRAPEQLYYPLDGHCTPAGYAVVAETLYRALIEKQLVP